MTPSARPLRAAVVTAYAAGQSSRQVAREHRVSTHTVLRWARLEGVSIRSKAHRRGGGGYGAELRARAVAMVAAGRTTREAADRCGVHIDTVRRWVARSERMVL